MHPSLWTPTADEIEDSNLHAFIKGINQQLGLKIEGYGDLYAWSIDQPEAFWLAVWHACQIKASQKWERVLEHPNSMQKSQWFTGARLNFAENLLRRHDNHPAILYQDETGQRRQMSFNELNAQVAKTAHALKSMGVKENDRVAGYLTNQPETVIAMLAAASLGAIWSSCSPDFGPQGALERFNQIQPKVLFASESYFYQGKHYPLMEKITHLKNNIQSIAHVVLVPYRPEETSEHSAFPYFQEIIEEHPPQIEFVQLPFDHPLYIMFSSGTTGKPKCIVHGAGGTLLQQMKEHRLHTNLKKNDRLFYFTTCGWMMWHWLVCALANLTTIVLYEGCPTYPNASMLFDLIDNEKINVFGISAKYLSAVEKQAVRPKSTHQLDSLKVILSTGSPLLPSQYDYVYDHIKQNVRLSSISGGTDILSCFALGNPCLPVYQGELQCRGLGMAVKIFDDQGHSLLEEKGELVCTKPFPSMPIYFWNDETGEKFQHAYFDKFPNVWAHGDYASLTKRGGIIIYGRSDAVLNPGGIRIGTAEIYRQIEQCEEILDSVVIGQDWEGDTRIILFITLKNSATLDDALRNKINQLIKQNASPHHVPAKILQAPEIPKTLNGKIVELAVRDVVHGRPVKNLEALANPDALEFFKNIPELSR